MKALPDRPVGASPLGASSLGASPRRCRFKAVASLWLAFFSLQGRSLQDPPLAGSQSTCAPSGDRPGARAAFRRQHSGVCAFAHRTSGSSRAGLIACRACRVSAGACGPVCIRLPAGTADSMSHFPRCPASLGVPLPTPLSGLFRTARFSFKPQARGSLGPPQATSSHGSGPSGGPKHPHVVHHVGEKSRR